MAEVDLLHVVRSAWADVLGVDDVGSVPLDTNFMESGGNSLLLVMLWEQLHEQTGQTLKMSDLFQHGTVRAQVALLAANGERRELTEDLLAGSSIDTAIGARARQHLLGRARRTEPAVERAR